MKIISKGKDYYDYLQGIYGIDEKFILDRTKFLYKTQYPAYIESQSEFVVRVSVYIGDYRIDGFYTDEGFYFGQKLKNKLVLKKSIIWGEEYYEFKGYKFFSSRNNIHLELTNVAEKSISYKYDFPIVLRYDYPRHPPSEYPNPVLSDLGIASVIPPEECWNMIYNWLSKRETMKENIEEPDDKTKIINKGFDLKKSFRHRKNE